MLTMEKLVLHLIVFCSSILLASSNDLSEKTDVYDDGVYQKSVALPVVNGQQNQSKSISIQGTQKPREFYGQVDISVQTPSINYVRPQKLPMRNVCKHDGKLYPPGQGRLVDCNVCTCLSIGEWKCTEKACLPQGCLYQGKRYRVGSTRKQDCNTCACLETGIWLCTKESCLPKGCFYRGKEYPHGSSMKQDCNTCICSAGAFLCTRKRCFPKQCFYRGKAYPLGSSTRQDCNTCHCSRFGWACTKMACFPRFRIRSWKGK